VVQQTYSQQRQQLCRGWISFYAMLWPAQQQQQQEVQQVMLNRQWQAVQRVLLLHSSS
jgi:hypothetical protein